MEQHQQQGYQYHDHEYHEQPLHSHRAAEVQKSQWRYGPTDGVYMFIKFATNNGTAVGVVEQAVVLSKRAIYNMGGRFVGIARRMEIEDSSQAQFTPEAIVVFWFPCIKDAKLFFESDPRMKQPDFPAPAGFCEAWSVVRFYTPPREYEYNTFMISEVRLYRSSDYMVYKEIFARRFAKLLLDHDAQPFVTQSVGGEFIRRYCCPRDTIITVHLFKDPYHLRRVRMDPAWNELMEVQRDMAKEHTSYFTIDPRACP